MLQSPLTDSDGFLSKKDYSAQKKSCQKTLDSLTQDIKQGQAEIAATIENDPYLKELYGYVQSVKGIGPAIATEIISSPTSLKPSMTLKSAPATLECSPLYIRQGNTRAKLKLATKPINP